ncbi:hypothetical protein ACE01P_02140 [Flavobacterium sp. HJSW_4]
MALNCIQLAPFGFTGLHWINFHRFYGRFKGIGLLQEGGLISSDYILAGIYGRIDPIR